MNEIYAIVEQYFDVFYPVVISIVPIGYLHHDERFSSFDEEWLSLIIINVCCGIVSGKFLLWNIWQVMFWCLYGLCIKL
ncbi:unnamed protein product [Arabis nemorensis]|uniref:Uncharacterized protein n=1 Tax=Arabis nemorensis TaxID=586526 RepID=A0A565C422_9BRAS|nr:unnamed protein product [Arabis nemorensis]